MLVELHSHFLPQMDDGPEHAAVSIEMLAIWRMQGVEKVAATPHYIPHREPVNHFLTRRSEALVAMAGVAPLEMEILLGAEVLIEKGLSDTEDLQLLAIGNSKHILLELPYSPFKEWMLEEIYGIIHRFGLNPLLAHLERYTKWYNDTDLARVLSIRGATFQINNDALFKMSTRRFALELVRGGVPVVFASDAHNTDTRPPNTKAADKILASKLKTAEWQALTERNEDMLGV